MHPHAQFLQICDDKFQGTTKIRSADFVVRKCPLIVIHMASVACTVQNSPVLGYDLLSLTLFSCKQVLDARKVLPGQTNLSHRQAASFHA